jgi:hypothetical protein
MKQIKIVDEFNNPLVGAHVKQTGRGSSTGKDGIAYIHNDYGPATISYVGTKTQTHSFNSIPAKVVMKMDSLDEVVVQSNPKQETPKYLWPAIGFTVGLLILMSVGSEPKKVTL